ncbi:MAG: GIY-YIG nuclease family protein [Candidatus Pacebacteria bacterium]|nr:GIY-YIG nuclease family protein [Candidatus Paceibacterota bacterium]
MNNININGYKFEGPYDFDRNFDNTFSCIYAIVENNKLIYIGITSDINERFLDHHKEDCWRRNISHTNTLYILREGNESVRERIEQEIRDNFNTPCNEV